MINLSTLTSQQLKRAAEIKEQIEALSLEMASLLGTPAITSGATAMVTGSGKPMRRKISAAGIAKIRAAQKLRWARFKAANPAPKAGNSTAKKPKMSAAARAKIAAVAKARWAAAKAAGKKKL